MAFAYNDKVAFVNLSSKDVRVEKLGEKFFRTYLGGSTLALYYLTKGFDHAVDPLSPDNKLIFASSALAGIPVPGFSRLTVAAKSPLTGDLVKPRQVDGFHQN